MTEWQYSSMSVVDMLAAFLVNKLPPITGIPSLHTLLKALKIIMRCSQHIKLGLGPLGYLFVSIPQVHYTRFTNVPLRLPGPTPYTPNMNPAERDVAKLQWQAHKAENDNIRHMNEALTGLFLAVIQPTFKHNFGK